MSWKLMDCASSVSSDCKWKSARAYQTQDPLANEMEKNYQHNGCAAASELKTEVVLDSAGTSILWKMQRLEEECQH
jgi:hypothetical protein